MSETQIVTKKYSVKLDLPKTELTPEQRAQINGALSAAALRLNDSLFREECNRTGLLAVEAFCR